MALVHGGGIQAVGNGYELRLGSVRRAEAGVALYHAGVVEGLLFSGGNAHGHGFAQSEAGLMADLAVQAGVPASHIECEDSSSSTIGNWANSLPMFVGTDVEAEGLRAYPREVVSTLMAKGCLRAARQSEVDTDQLDAFYLDWKSRTGLAHAKVHLTRR